MPDLDEDAPMPKRSTCAAFLASTLRNFSS